MSFLRKFQYLLGKDQKLKVFGFLVCILLATAMELLSLSLMILLVMAVLDASFLQKLPFLKKYEYILNQWSRQELNIGFLRAFFGYISKKPVCFCYENLSSVVYSDRQLSKFFQII